MRSFNLNLNQNSEINVTLPNTPDKISDKNPEDNPVAFANAKSLDGKTQLTLNGNNLKIKTLSNYTGNYQVEIEYGSANGGLEKTVLAGQIIEHTWKYLANPFVQPNDTTKPIIWNNFSTIDERNSYFDDRLYNYDQIDKIENPDWVCSDYVRAWIIAFNGYPMEGLENNNWHNIPAYDVTFRVYNKPSHAAGEVIVGDYVSNISDWRLIETQNDSTYSPNKLKELGVYEVEINYTFVKENDVQGKFLSSIPLLKFVLNENNDWVDSGYRSTDINLVEERR